MPRLERTGRVLVYYLRNAEVCGLDDIGMTVARTFLFAAALAAAAPFFQAAAADLLFSVRPEAIAEFVPLAMDAVRINCLAKEREARHNAELARRGIAEVPPTGSQRYVIDIGTLPEVLAFDERGEFYIDRRFVTDSEMKTVHAIEAWARKWIPGMARKRVTERKSAGRAGLPVFRGFEDDRYQMHDEMIARLVAEFNADKAGWCGGTPAQAAGVADITPELVKAHMIEESGGNGPKSKAAWAVDPLQVNVPGDWGEEKRLVGLEKPAKRNEGAAKQNIRAAIMYLSRKGFGAAAKPAMSRPKGFFDGWHKALQRYNGRRDRTDTDRYYSDEYADKIMRRAKNPDVFVPIEIKLAKKSPEDGTKEAK